MNFCRIANATEGDAGVYACIVGTAEEHVRSVAHLAVEEGAEYIATSVAREGHDSIKSFHMILLGSSMMDVCKPLDPLHLSALVTDLQYL